MPRKNKNAKGTGQKRKPRLLKALLPKVKVKVDYPKLIANELLKLGVECKLEHKFLEKRKFRFDIAIPKYYIAIEFEGGIYTNGRHTRALGYANDCKKYNLATLNGWKLLRYTIKDVHEIGIDGIAEVIKDFTEKTINNWKE